MNSNQLNWLEGPYGIVIMGKRQGTKKENKQLWGRVAMAAALWYSAPNPKPYLIFVASDVHGPDNIPDAKAVKKLLLEKFDISADYIILRQKSNCTLLEVRAIRVLCRAYHLKHIFAITHLYHAPRVQRYINEVLPEAVVIPAHPDILSEIAFPAEYNDLLPDLQTTIENSLPSPFDTGREHFVEFCLNVAHTLDPRGRFERCLARILRPNTY